MTLLELSGEYRASAAALREAGAAPGAPAERGGRGRTPSAGGGVSGCCAPWGREARELAVLCERYYERGTAAMANTHAIGGGGAYAADMGGIRPRHGRR